MCADVWRTKRISTVSRNASLPHIPSSIKQRLITTVVSDGAHSMMPGGGYANPSLSFAALFPYGCFNIRHTPPTYLSLTVFSFPVRVLVFPVSTPPLPIPNGILLFFLLTQLLRPPPLYPLPYHIGTEGDRQDPRGPPKHLGKELQEEIKARPG